MNVILIDTPAKTVALVEIEGMDKLTLEMIYSLLGCQTIEAHNFPGDADHAFYCDEEATLKDPLPDAFLLKGFPQLIFGRALIFRKDGDEEASVTLTAEAVAQRIIFGQKIIIPAPQHGLN